MRSVTETTPSQGLPNMMNDDQFKKRVQLDFSKPAYTRMVELKQEAGASTLSNVIRQALLLFDWYITYRRQGYRLQMSGPSGTVEVPDLAQTF